MTEFDKIIANTIWTPPSIETEACFNGNWKIVFRFAQPMPNLFHRTMQRLILGIHWRKFE
tara:strand:- start:3479 stop:3658 length:180 start_codon:yes stop_codon:yes gene_type:complete